MLILSVHVVPLPVNPETRSCSRFDWDKNNRRHGRRQKLLNQTNQELDVIGAVNVQSANLHATRDFIINNQSKGVPYHWAVIPSLAQLRAVRALGEGARLDLSDTMLSSCLL